MSLFAAFFRMVRYPNLIYIALTQFLLQYCVVEPLLQNSGAVPSLSFPHFLMLCFSTVLVAAGGYIINDYFDINIDLVNKPDKMVVDKIINRRWAMARHTILNMTGVSLGFLVAFQIGQFLSRVRTGILHPAAVVLFHLVQAAGAYRKRGDLFTDRAERGCGGLLRETDL